MKSFWYEQTPLLNAQTIDRVYKFDHRRIGGGEWKSLNNRPQAHYRSINEHFQLVFPHLQMTDGEYREILAAIVAAGPLNTDDELEILIRPSGTGFEMTSHWISLGNGAIFPSFTPEEWNEAYRRLRDMEAQE